MTTSSGRLPDVGEGGSFRSRLLLPALITTSSGATVAVTDVPLVESNAAATSTSTSTSSTLSTTTRRHRGTEGTPKTANVDNRRFLGESLQAERQHVEAGIADTDDAWLFAGWGSSSTVEFLDVSEAAPAATAAEVGDEMVSPTTNGASTPPTPNNNAASQAALERQPLLARSNINGEPSDNNNNNNDDDDVPPIAGVLKKNAAEAADAHKLNQYLATAISGNDITSSVFYMCGIAFFVAGQMSFVSVVLVIITLYLFRRIYGEVCTALPLNGGTYNALLNTSTKYLASMAAGLSILSYLATAVVSATSAVNYLQTVFFLSFLSFVSFRFIIGETNIFRSDR